MLPLLPAILNIGLELALAEVHSYMRYTKVIFLGGAPILGKTTVARILACRLRYSSVSTDDIGIAIGSVTMTDRHPYGTH